MGMNGFLGTGATWRADLNLLIQLAMGVMLLFGMVLARKKKFRHHKYCQTSVMLLNLVMIALVMSPSFHRQVQPKIPSGLGDSYYAVAAIHAGLGTIAEILGLYIVLRAATNILPQSLRFKRYRPWMRTELALWWVVIIFGIVTYCIWYVAPSHQPQAAEPRAAEAAPAQRKTVQISNFQFEPKELTVPAGTIVEWVDSTGRHSVEADDGSFKSDTLTAGGRFEHKFDQPGTFPYYCGFHGNRGGKDMAGTVVVRPRAKP
jgi:plastocyanin/uncharacterized membrane protein YozB (DUF420 family)